MPRDDFVFNRMTFASQEKFIQSGRRCGTPIPNDLQIDRVARELRAFRRSARAPERAAINVQFIHITNGDEGKIREEQRVEQIAVLNKAYEAHGIRFAYDPASVMEVDRPEWFHMGHRSQTERQAKTALHVNPQRNLNFYTGGLQGGLLGWATFPFDLVGDPEMDGVVMLWTSLPGGTGAPYNLGQTATHEVGHWLGLYHTFEPKGTCDPIGDRVEDTPAHRDPDYGKPEEGAHTVCQPGQNSPIHNFMNYTDDEWMNHFSAGQGHRMREQIGLYRPSLEDTSVEVEPAAELKLAATASGHLGMTGDERTFSIDLPAKATVTLDGPGGVDFDLYVKRDAPPTTSVYDDRAYSPGSDESLVIEPPSPGRYYVMARSYAGAGNFTLTIALD